MKERQMNPISILLADDNQTFLRIAEQFLQAQKDLVVIGTAANGSEAIDIVRELQPDVVLMDIAMPIMGGLEATRRICREFPKIKVLVLTQYDDKEYVLPVIEAGASGFISKAAASSELISGIRSVYRGDSYLSPPVAKLLIEGYRYKTGGKVAQDPYEELTDRERDVLKLMAEGHTNKEIADILVISRKTVEGHKTNLMAKLDIHNRTELVKYALRKGIITV